ncbi:MAG TPA: hypothetical protein VFV34_00755 [Blastocatellia bacterium]|nr:hypothetical protein [Blastocatellia bacterium]
MTNEELTAKMEFIIEQQAQTSARVESLAVRMDNFAAAVVEAQANYETRLSRLEDGFAGLTAKLDTLVELETRSETRLSRLEDGFAALTAKMETLAELETRSETRLTRLEDAFALTVQFARVTDERLDTLTANVDALTVDVRSMAESITRLTEAQSATDDRVNALVNVVERLISEGRNGRA